MGVEASSATAVLFNDIGSAASASTFSFVTLASSELFRLQDLTKELLVKLRGRANGNLINLNKVWG